MSPTYVASGDGAREDEALTAEEEHMGVQIHRIAVRVAGRIRNTPYKGMPDADDASKFVIVQKAPESGVDGTGPPPRSEALGDADLDDLAAAQAQLDAILGAPPAYVASRQ